MKYEINLNEFSIPHNVVMIEADKIKNMARKLKRNDGSEVFLYLDMDVDPLRADKVCIDGIVRKLPMALIPKTLKMEVAVGDHVYCSAYMTSEEDHFIIDGKECWGLEYPMDFLSYVSTNIFCKIVGGKIKMIADWNFIEEIPREDKTESGLELNTNWNNHHREGLTRGILKHLCKESKDLGLKKGDIVYFKDQMRYNIYVEGQHYFRVSSRDILAAEK